MPPPPFTQTVSNLPLTVPFVGPEAQERQLGFSFRARIGANESPFGPSPLAIAAMTAASSEAWKYCDPENYDLRQALAEHHRVRRENVVVGEGIDALLGYTVRMFVEPGTAVVTSFGAYPTFNFHVAGHGGRLLTVPYRDDRADLEALVEIARHHEARLMFLANPDNPMGSWWGAADIQRLIDTLPDDLVLCLDEAYLEFAPPGTAPPVDVANPKVLRFRTFSKAYGLAGARIGFVLGETGLITSFNRVRNHFGVNRIAQRGALAALADHSHLRKVIRKTGRARERIATIAAAAGLTPLTSAANFVTIDCGRDGAFARRLLGRLVERQIFVRMPGVAPLDRCIRVSVGLASDLDVFAEALPEALRAAEEPAQQL
jgi:histidinol-phosphate aminotransferase